MIKVKNLHFLNIGYWYVNNLCSWAMSRKLPVNKLESIEDTSQFNEDFI